MAKVFVSNDIIEADLFNYKISYGKCIVPSTSVEFMQRWTKACDGPRRY